MNQVGITMERQSNLELLRIVAMFLIVLGHYSAQGGVMNHAEGLNLVVLSFLGHGARIAVNLFLMIGCWFLCDHRIRPAKILLIWGETFFYGTVITSIMLIIGNASAKNLVTVFFPIIRRPFWFASVYIFLILLAPLLQYAFNLNRYKFRNALGIGFAAICVICSVSEFMDTFLDCLVWFVYVFLLVGYYKKYMAVNQIRKERFLLIALGLYGILVTSVLLDAYSENVILNLCGRICNQYLSDYKSIPNVVCSFCLFIYFTKLRMNVHHTINRMASSAFAVYVIHQVPSFHDFLWMSIFRIHVWYTSPLLVPYFLLSAVCLYGICHLIDMTRRKWIEPLWVNSRIYCFLEQEIRKLMYGNY